MSKRRRYQLIFATVILAIGIPLVLAIRNARSHAMKMSDL